MKIIALFLSCLVLAPIVCLAAPVKSSLSGLPQVLPNDAILFIRTLRISDGSLAKSTRQKKGTQFSIKTTEEPSIVAVTFISRAARKVLKGVSKKLSVHSTKKQLATALKIKLKRQPSAIRSSSALHKLATSAGTVAGIPIDGISVSGPGTFPAMANSQVQLLQHFLVNNSACYNQDGGYVLVDLDPAVMAAREVEFALCNNGLADPATCVADNYQAPTQLIKGSLTTNGTQATLSLTITDAQGNTLSQVSAIGSIKSIEAWEKLTSNAGKQIADTLCASTFIQVTSAQCDTPPCDFPCGQASAIKVLPTVRGIARGPVGSGVSVGMSKIFGRINCGSWDIAECSAILCCKRSSESQPEETSFEAVLDLYQGTCVCPATEPVVYDIISQVTGSKPLEEERMIQCPA